MGTDEGPCLRISCVASHVAWSRTPGGVFLWDLCFFLTPFMVACTPQCMYASKIPHADTHMHAVGVLSAENDSAGERDWT